ncbi:alternative ribosome rescue aminoacyl-tRNA hydrolase ArfB [Quadrisphaera sp. KR29]|uniref:alternative ribosome rescue aminoacyl-tRNA hydrolase ArfB n=1 Tax=Quadrisphaera sp. KR29 TaxID=3461391 RepID=UPI004044FC01
MVTVPGRSGRAAGRLVLPAEELRWRFSRSSGPGGQGVNTADSRVELSWDVAGSRALDEAVRERLLEALEGRLVDGVLVVAASQHRQQRRNRSAARDRLAALVASAAAAPPPARRVTRISAGAGRRRAEAKRSRSSTKALRRRPDW